MEHNVVAIGRVIPTNPVNNRYYFKLECCPPTGPESRFLELVRDNGKWRYGVTKPMGFGAIVWLNNDYDENYPETIGNDFYTFFREKFARYNFNLSNGPNGCNAGFCEALINGPAVNVKVDVNGLKFDELLSYYH